MNKITTNNGQLTGLRIKDGCMPEDITDESVTIWLLKRWPADRRMDDKRMKNASSDKGGITKKKMARRTEGRTKNSKGDQCGQLLKFLCYMSIEIPCRVLGVYLQENKFFHP